MLKLREVIWEVTNRCNKECAYCGSKKIKDEPTIDENAILKIANELNKYGVEEVTLSGGEPGCLTYKLLNDIIKALTRNNRCKVKMVTNGRALKCELDWNKVECVGLSINTPDEYAYAEQNLCLLPDVRLTMITNFGSHNIFDVKKLAACFASDIFRFGYWQVQLTMGQYMLNSEGIKYLYEQLHTLNNTNIVLADNLQYSHKCTAGMRSCGILHDGRVVACLSERSFMPGIPLSYGNVLEESIKDIWENKFKDIRFQCGRKCCRDYIQFPDMQEDCKPGDTWRPVPPFIMPPYKIDPKMPTTQPQIVMYAVFSPPYPDWKQVDIKPGTTPDSDVRYVYGTI